jgi:rSAM/selenodomain-associated transferase 1
MQLAVIAKEPRPGRVKTRLCPPCTPHQAAALAAAALADTLDVVAATPASRRTLVLDGQPGQWVRDAFHVVPQRGKGLDERLHHAFVDLLATCPEPILLIGMDTPQVTPDHLRVAGRLLARRDDAVIGPATDGGYWLIGLAQLRPEAIIGVAMSTAHTGAAQRSRLRDCGYRIRSAPVLEDVDTFDDARRVAEIAPDGRFARAVRQLEPASTTIPTGAR